MPGFVDIENKSKIQTRDPNSRRQKKFQTQRARGKMSSIPKADLSGGGHTHVPIQSDGNGHIIPLNSNPSLSQDNPYFSILAFDQQSHIGSNKNHSKTISLGSGFTAATGQTGHTNQNFYVPKKSSTLNPKAHTWKSPAIKLEEDFARMHKVVSFIAPEQFKNPAKPTDGPCGIVPTTISEFVEHRQFMTKMSSEQMQKNITSMKDQIVARKAHGAIKSVLGKDAKVHDSGFSPILCMPTIWANEFVHFNFPQANWPSQSELQFNGDNRQKLATRCGRYLPPPRYPVHEDVKFYDAPILSAMLFDQTGPIFANGPNPMEIMTGNAETDNDVGFENTGRALLGGKLMEEIDE